MSLSRRDFGRLTLVGLCTSTLPGTNAETPSQTPQSGNGWIDAHSHIWTTDLEKFPLASGQTREDLKPASFTAEELLELAGKSQVRRVVLIQHKPYHGVDNSYITSSIRQYPGRFGGVACIDAEAAHPEREMERLKSEGIRGFRIVKGEGGQPHWKDSSGMQAMWRHAAACNLAICPLVNPDELPMVGDMCRAYPDTKVVIDHFARIGMSGKIDEAQLKLLAGLAAHKHVHVKISAYYALGAKMPPHTELIPMIATLYETFGPRKTHVGQ